MDLSLKVQDGLFISIQMRKFTRTLKWKKNYCASNLIFNVLWWYSRNFPVIDQYLDRVALYTKKLNWKSQTFSNNKKFVRRFVNGNPDGDGSYSQYKF
jgi:hypothetical protein